MLVRRDIDFDWICNLTGRTTRWCRCRRPDGNWPRAALAASSSTSCFHWRRPLAAQQRVSRYCFGYVRSARLSARGRQLMLPLAAINRVQPVVRISPVFGAAGIHRRVRTVSDGPDAQVCRARCGYG